MIRIDHSTLQAYRRCPRYAQHRYVNGLTRTSESNNLAFGTLAHTFIEHFYPGYDLELALGIAKEEHDASVLTNLDASRQYSWYHAETLFRAYVKHWEGESLKMSIAEVGMEMKINDLITYTGTADGFIEYQNQPMILENKTSFMLGKNFIDLSNPNGQATGYVMLANANGFKCDTVLFNGLQTAHRKIHGNPTECFLRIQTKRTAEQIEEFKRNLIRSCDSLARDIEEGYFAQHEGQACNIYNRRCMFDAVCMAPASLRPQLLETFNHEPWKGFSNE